MEISEFAGRLFEFLDLVEQGEALTITRGGRTVARILPDDPEQRQKEVDQALAEIRELRKSMPRISLEEILSSRHEGHKY